ncbi:Alanine racemase [Cordyceps fumosorosea ARSEF 2679]|uniref:Alanine racemase n=1 Tax=Cordyceps fumosorosea (strain ARSEF 2679) TaxID=1081104 RepID=A0A168E7X0_CORFA|nr:Alanine racemase [Cordyceps fumosorosea ARSEF 2679]OAA73478.1 Alanine racemase [Cordyceps fumosorosea ARSEF 2679]
MPVPQRLNPSQESLQQFYVGKDIHNVPTPALVLDRAKMRRHCESLSAATEALGVDFRAHVKTHKTVEGTRLQVGQAKLVKLVASTIAEIEHLLPLLQEYQQQGRQVNILYGIPLPQSQISRLAAIGLQLGPKSLSVLVDHADQLKFVSRFHDEANFPAGVYVKVDTGYHRAGLPPWGLNKDSLLSDLVTLDAKGIVDFVGLYSHSSLSYNDSTPAQAMANLEAEITGCMDAMATNHGLFPENKSLVISVGASPQVSAVENLLDEDSELSPAAQSLRAVMQFVAGGTQHGIRTSLELHAGVYSILDVQQLSTRCRAKLGDYEDEIAISVVSEVCSVYNNGEREQPEVLVAAGVLALGREPCAAYKGWGVVDRSTFPPKANANRQLIVSRVSQEHSILAWDSSSNDASGGQIPLTVGQSIRIYPNHACITVHTGHDTKEEVDPRFNFNVAPTNLLWVFDG